MRTVVETPASVMLERYLEARIPPDAEPMKSLSHIYSYGTRVFLCDDVGMMMKGSLDLNDMCDVHICFWDRILNGREYMANFMAKMVATDAGKRGSWTAIPTDARATIAFCKRCGFEEFHRTDAIVALALLVT